MLVRGVGTDGETRDRVMGKIKGVYGKRLN